MNIREIAMRHQIGVGGVRGGGYDWTAIQCDVDAAIEAACAKILDDNEVLVRVRIDAAIGQAKREAFDATRTRLRAARDQAIAGGQYRDGLEIACEIVAAEWAEAERKRDGK